MPDALASILDAPAHASRRAEAAALHAAQRAGSAAGARPDNSRTIAAFAASAAGMRYEHPYFLMRVPPSVRLRDRRPFGSAA